MSNLNLYTHCGSHKATRDQVFDCVTPAGTRTHVPIDHSVMLELVESSLEDMGLGVIQEVHALSPDGMKYFGMMEVASENPNDEFSTVLGLRNSNDMSFAAGLVIGSGVFVCDNLCFSGEVKVARKHTRRIMETLPEMMDAAIGKVIDAQELQAKRIASYKETELVPTQVNDMLIEAFDSGVISSAKIGQVLTEYRAPRHQEFVDAGPTAWRLMNAFTEILKPRDSGHDLFKLPAKTQKLHAILDRASESEAHEDVNAE